VKLYLTAEKLRATIEPEESDKAIAIIFIRRHVPNTLQTDYLTEDDPRALWIILQERFDH